MKLNYKVIENGYIIYDSEDVHYKIKQVEPFIPYRGKDYEESAKNHITNIESSYNNPYNIHSDILEDITVSIVKTIKDEVVNNV